VPNVPEITALPTIMGIARQGETLTESHGTWTNSPTSYGYQWQRCNSSGDGCAPIPGATAQAYVPVKEDVGHELRVKEAAVNAGGAGIPAESGATAGLQPAAGNPPARVVLSVSSVTVSHGVALIPLGCPASAVGGCHGRITITVQVAEPRARRAGAARCARGCRPLASSNYEASAGQRVRVRVHIASFGRRLLANRRSVRVTLTATSVAGGQTATVTRAITLRRA
jgi:hypothetical protein